jgi:hypothetical protein
LFSNGIGVDSVPGVAVVQSVADDEKSEEKGAFIRTGVEDLADLEEGREASLAGAKARFVLKVGKCG